MSIEEGIEEFDCGIPEICSPDDYDKVEAKERASVLWLLSKAFDGNIPADLQEPFYRDHEQHRRLKPKIVHSLANAELYCLALAHIYSDPNFHNLDHHGIIQALTRKGICLVESRDAPLTETILVQTAPLKMNAHLAVIDGIISLYIKEVLIPEKIVDVVKGFSQIDPKCEIPSNPEEAAVLWINKCCTTLQSEIAESVEAQDAIDKVPRIPVLQEIADVSDGCSLAAVISFYCPTYLRWQDIYFNEPMSLGDSIYNLQLVKRFCCYQLPRYVDCLTLEDLLYVHPTIKDNVLVFVAELLFSFVIWPESCVSRFGTSHEPRERSHVSGQKSRSSSIPSHKAHQVPGNTIPNLRSDSYGGSTSSLPELRAGSGAPSEGSKDSSEKLLKKASVSNDRLRMSPQLQRARSSGVVNGCKSNNTSTSSLTNSGDNELRFSGSSRPEISPSEASEMHTVAKDSQQFQDFSQRDDLLQSRKSFSDIPAQAVDRCLSSGLKDYYHNLAMSDGPVRSGSLSNIRENKIYRSSGNERPNFKVHDSASSQSSGICVSDFDKNTSTTSFAQCRDPNSAINIVYMQQDKDTRSRKPLKPNLLQKGKPEKRTTFAALPNTTTWQKLALSSGSSQADSGHETPSDSVNPSLRVKLAVIRMQLDEKRREIEIEKKRLEARNKRLRQKLGKVAFLQAVGMCGSEADTPDSGTGKEDDDAEPPPVPEKAFDTAISSPSLVRRMSIQEIADDLDSVQKKWLERHDVSAINQRNLVDVETEADDSLMNPRDFQASIEQLNSSLCDLQADISRISIEQEHVENLMQDSVEDASFYLHGHSKPLESFTKMWGPSSLQLTPCGRVSNFDFSPSPMSPIRQLYPKPASQKQINFSRDDSFTTTLRQRDNTVNVEDLYSKVIKPDNRQKNISKLGHSGEHVASKPTQQTCRIESSPTKSHVVGRQHSYDNSPQRVISTEQRSNIAPDTSRKQSSNESDQGFYISFDDQPKKSTTKWQRPQVNGNKTHTEQKTENDESNAYGFVIGADLVHPDPETEVEMAKKKEQIMNLSIKRRADHESRRIMKEQEYARLREEEQRKRELAEKKREEERKRREAILEQYRQRKLQDKLDEETSQDGQSIGKSMGISKTRSSSCLQRKSDNRICSDFTKPIAELRTHVALQKRTRPVGKTRPRSAYVNSSGSDHTLLDGNAANRRNSQCLGSGKTIPEFDIDSLNSMSTDSSKDRERSPSNDHSGTYRMSSQSNHDGGLRPPEAGGCSSDGASDTTSNSSNVAVASEYTGPKLFVKPTAKSNRSIIINAMHAVLAGSVNAETKKKVLEEINRSESKHFLILFRGAGCQFRALYTYNPDTGEVIKMYGIGPKSVSEKVMERFYKYNSGGKCFSEIQTKHLTVTIDAFTIPNSLWAGKKVVPPRKEFF